MSQEEIRSQIAELGQAFLDAQRRPAFIAGETYIPVSGKVLDGDDLRHLLNASLDLWLTAGRFMGQFEKALAKRVGARKALMTVSGSAANLLAFSALTSPQLGDRRVEAGSEVITVAAGFPTTLNPILQLGCLPVFVDINLETHNIDVSQLEAARSPKTRAVMVAHTLGNPFDVEAVKEFCHKHELFLIEDCCDALGASFDGKTVGTFGDLATLSFYPAHHITTGEGGAVYFNAPKFQPIVASFRDWGRDCWCEPGSDNTCGKRFDWKLGGLPPGYDHKYIYSHVGYNLKATDMQAALGLSQLQKLDGFIAKRQQNHAELTAGFRAAGLDHEFILPEATPNSVPSWFGFALTLRESCGFSRADLVRRLEARRIGTRLLFGGDLRQQPAYAGQPMRSVGALPNTKRVMHDSFWVGVWPGIGSAQIAYMIETFKDVIEELRP